jgi:hypothetical protein
LGGCIQEGCSSFEIVGVLIKAGFDIEESLKRGAWDQDVKRRTLGTDFHVKDSHWADPQTVQSRHQGLPKEVFGEFDLWPPQEVVTPKLVILATLPRCPQAAEKMG